MADFRARVIFIPNAIKYNKPQSPNVVKSWESHWDELPECELKNIAYEKIKAFLDNMGKAFAEAFEQATRKPSGKTNLNQEQDKEQEQERDKTIDEVATSPNVDSRVNQSVSNEAQEIFNYWQKTMNHPRAKLDNKRKCKIMQARKLGYLVDDLKKAIEGCSKIPFNMGQNERNQRYDDLELILRDASHIDRFIGNAINPPAANDKKDDTNNLMLGAI